MMLVLLCVSVRERQREKYIIYKSGRDYTNFKKHVLVLVALLRVLTQACKKMQVTT